MGIIFSLSSSLMIGCGQNLINEASIEQSSDKNETEQSDNKADEDKDDNKTSKKSVAQRVALLNPAVSAKELVNSAYTSSDEYYDFRVDLADDYLEKVNTMFSLLDERYISEYEDESELYANDERSQITYLRAIPEYEERYKYIKEIDMTLGFEDNKKDLFAWQRLYLTLCDEDQDGKIEVNDQVSTILKAFYPDIDMDEVQEKINIAIEQEKEGSFEGNYIYPEEKYYGWISFSYFRYYEDNPVEVQISLDWYQNYPDK